jgi:HD-GYP domain-containing protein (c-di-GMP phosphodiesterase class II)
MRLVATEHLKTGDRIGRDITTSGEFLLLLRAGIRISDGFRQSLDRAGITSVWVDDKLSEGIEPLEMLQEQTKQRAISAIRSAFADVSQSLVQGSSLSADTIRKMIAVSELIGRDIAENAQSALALNDLANADSYTMKHSLAVTALGLALGIRVMRRYGWIDHHGGRRFDQIEPRLAQLGVGLLLHDIGKLAVPPEILQKPGPLTEEEWTPMRAHSMLGFQMLKGTGGVSALARSVVRSHHERWDGTGYPDGKTGGAIHQFARIATVADVFDALTSARPYSAGQPAHRAFKYVVSRAGRDFDPDVVDVFRSSVAPYPPGTGVVLSDGSRGLVSEVRPAFVECPIVRIVVDPSGRSIPPRDVDLSTTPELTIVSADVAPLEAPAS